MIIGKILKNEVYIGKVVGRKYENPPKGLVFCRECGKIATLRCRTETRKSGTVWRADFYFKV